MDCFNDYRNWTDGRLNLRGKLMWVAELLYYFVACLFVLCVFMGIGTCISMQEATEMKTYQVTVYTSTGALHNEFKVQSVSRPKLEARSGNLYLSDKGTSDVHEWERNPVAPSGWLVTVEPITEEDRRE